MSDSSDEAPASRSEPGGRGRGMGHAPHRPPVGVPPHLLLPPQVPRRSGRVPPPRVSTTGPYVKPSPPSPLAALAAASAAAASRMTCRNTPPPQPLRSPQTDGESLLTQGPGWRLPTASATAATTTGSTAYRRRPGSLSTVLAVLPFVVLPTLCVGALYSADGLFRLVPKEVVRRCVVLDARNASSGAAAAPAAAGCPAGSVEVEGAAVAGRVAEVIGSCLAAVGGGVAGGGAAAHPTDLGPGGVVVPGGQGGGQRDLAASGNATADWAAGVADALFATGHGGDGWEPTLYQGWRSTWTQGDAPSLVAPMLEGCYARSNATVVLAVAFPVMWLVPLLRPVGIACALCPGAALPARVARSANLKAAALLAPAILTAAFLCFYAMYFYSNLCEVGGDAGTGNTTTTHTTATAAVTGGPVGQSGNDAFGGGAGAGGEHGVSHAVSQRGALESFSNFGHGLYRSEMGIHGAVFFGFFVDLGMALGIFALAYAPAPRAGAPAGALPCASLCIAVARTLLPIAALSLLAADPAAWRLLSIEDSHVTATADISAWPDDLGDQQPGFSLAGALGVRYDTLTPSGWRPLGMPAKLLLGAGSAAAAIEIAPAGGAAAATAEACHEGGGTALLQVVAVVVCIVALSGAALHGVWVFYTGVLLPRSAGLHAPAPAPATRAELAWAAASPAAVALLLAVAYGASEEEAVAAVTCADPGGAGNSSSPRYVISATRVGSAFTCVLCVYLGLLLASWLGVFLGGGGGGGCAEAEEAGGCRHVQLAEDEEEAEGEGAEVVLGESGAPPAGVGPTSDEEAVPG